MRAGRSKTYGLFKSCKHLSWEKCECPWLGRYRQVRYVNLGEWAGINNPSKTRAAVILNEQLKPAIRNGTFRKEGVTKVGEGMAFGEFCKLYRAALIDRGVAQTKESSTHSYLNVWEKAFPTYTLEQLASSPIIFENWLKDRSKEKGWTSNVSWNRWLEFGRAMFNWAQHPKQGLVKRNPFLELDTKQEQRSKPPRLDDGGVKEADLFAAVEAAYPPAEEHPKLDALNANRRRAMKRRLIGALDMGLRARELAHIRLSDVNFKTWEITLPTSKGESKTGEQERVYALTPRLQEVLNERRFLKAPNDFVFGREDGSFQTSWRKAWHSIFTKAGLPAGRKGGFVWHSLRHEFISSLAELTDNVQEVKELARHRNISTTETYMKAKEERLRDLLRRKGQRA